MVSIDEEFRFGPADACCYRRSVKLIVNSSFSLALLLQDVRTTRFGESFHSRRRFLTQPEQSEWFVVTSTCNNVVLSESLRFHTQQTEKQTTFFAQLMSAETVNWTLSSMQLEAINLRELLIIIRFRF